MTKIISFAKLSLLICFTWLVIYSHNWQILFILLLLLILLSLLLKPKRQLVKRLKPLLLIGLTIILINLFFNMSFVPEDRLSKGILYAGKFVNLSLSVFIFTAITSPSEIVALFSFLPKQMTLALSITFSIIPVIMSEIDKITLIQKTRGHNFRSFNPKKSIFPLIVPLLHRTLKRGEQIGIVLLARGYED